VRITDQASIVITPPVFYWEALAEHHVLNTRSQFQLSREYQYSGQLTLRSFEVPKAYDPPCEEGYTPVDSVDPLRQCCRW